MKRKGAQVLGISVDTVERQREFKEKHRLPYPLLSDEGGKVAAQYAGKMAIVGLANRANYVIDQDGTIRAIVTGNEAVDPTSAIASCPIRR